MRNRCRDREMIAERGLRLNSGLLRRVRIVSDPKRLAQLYAEAEKWKRYAREERVKVERN